MNKKGMLHYPEAVQYVKEHPNLKTKALHQAIVKKFKIQISYRLVQQWRSKYILGYKKKKAEHPSWWGRKVGEEFSQGKYLWIRTKDGAKPKQHVVWEQYHEQVGKCEVIVFLDGNERNFDIENLYLVNRRHLAVVNKILKDKEVTPDMKKMAINLAVLKVATSDKEYTLKGMHNPQKFYRFSELERKIIKLHQDGKTNFEITTLLNKDPSHVSQTIRRYKLGYYDRFF